MYMILLYSVSKNSAKSGLPSRAASHVVVMEAGQVTAEGAPSELMDVSPFYTKLMSGEEGAQNA